MTTGRDAPLGARLNMGEVHEDQARNIQRIRAWMETRARKSGFVGVATIEFQRDLIADEIKKWESIFGFDALIVTLREARGMIDGLLRPVYTKPSNLYGFFADPREQKPFQLEPRCLPEDGIVFEDYYPSDHYRNEEGTSAALPLVRANLINTSDLFNSSSQNANLPKDHVLSKRIFEFLRSVGKYGDTAFRDDVLQLQNNERAHCFVIGTTDTATFNGPAKFSYTHFFAIYFIAGAKFDQSRLEAEAQWRASGLFSCLQLIKELDASHLQRDSLALLSHLTPVFHNRTLPLADKLAYGIECMKDLLAGHLVGVDYSCSELTSALPKVTYVETNFRRPMNRSVDSNLLSPTFQIYPEIYRNEAPIASFLLAHPKSLATAKYALYRYFERTKIFLDGDLDDDGDDGEAERKLDSEFTNLFKSDVDQKLLLEAEQRATFTGRLPDEFCISAFENAKLWERLHISADSERGYREANSVLTYVVEGAKCTHNIGTTSTSRRPERRQLPHGILVIESPMGDAFANSDIQSLRVLVAGIASLIRSIRHPSSPIDYEREIQTSFEIETAPDATGTLMRGEGSGPGNGTAGPLASAFLFQMIRLDAEIYKGIILSTDQRISDLTGLSQAQRAEIWRAHEEILKPVSDDESKDKQHELLRTRRLKFLQADARLGPLYSDLGRDKVFDFFAACPSNYIWSAYLGAAAQVLGDRADKLPPRFSRIGVGFSADALLIADIKGELKQIIKLSSKSKLSTELNRYLKFVRYRLPFSARIPVSALAMDSSGQAGRIAAKASQGKHLPDETPRISLVDGLPPYGALVSDLVDSGNLSSTSASVSTLLTRTADIVNEMRRGHDALAVKELAKVTAAITEFFGVGLSLWSTLPDAEKPAFVDEFFGKRVKHNVNLDRVIRRLSRLTVEGAVTFDRVLGNCLGALEPEKVSKFWKILETCAVHYKHWDVQADGSDKPFGHEDLLSLIRQAQYISGLATNRGTNSHLERALLGETILNCGPIPAIVHGDMNAQNLAWAAAFSRFFAIDFEHTGYGFWGVDQARLIYSLTADLFFELYSRSKGVSLKLADRPDIVKRALMEVQAGLNFLDHATDFLDGGDMGQFADVARPNFDEWYAGLIKSPLQSILFVILSTIIKDPSDSATTEWIGKNSKVQRDKAGKIFDSLVQTITDKQTPITFMLVCAATKEFEHALKDVDNSVIDCLSEAVNFLQHNKPAQASLRDDQLMSPLAILERIALQADVRPNQVRAASRLLITFSALLASAQQSNRANK